jgi:rhodanese-related sulfurtransferase
MNKVFFFLAVLVLAVAGVLLLLPNVQRQKLSPPQAFLNEINSNNRYLSTDEIARRIIDEDPTLYLVDVRSADEFDTYSLPGAVNIPFENLLDSEWADKLNQDVLDVIFFANDDIYAEQAWALCQQQGFSNLYVMAGGLNKWFATIMLPEQPSELASSEELELYSFRTGASIYFGSGTVEVPVVVEVEVEEEPKPVEKKQIPVRKKVKVEDEGGC